MEKYLLKESYIKYLRDVRGIKESSIRHYLDALQYISRFLVQKGSLKETIFEICDIIELEQLKEILFSDQDFVSLDKRGHQMYSAGLNNYLRFANGADLENSTDISKLDITIAKPEKTENTQWTWKRSSIIKRQVIRAAQYMCEYDKGHKTFIAKTTGFQYMEGHHAIPISRQIDFDCSLDVYANVVCLCPVCHRLLHYGEDSIKENVLNKIYFERADRLVQSGIKISAEEFKKMAL